MALIETLQTRFGADFHPAMLLAQVVANKTDAMVDFDYDIKLRVECAKSLMPYLESVRKAVEIKADINAEVGLLRVSLFQEAIGDEVEHDLGADAE